jgi:hypothetical protein
MFYVIFHHVDVGSVTDVSEVHGLFIVEASKARPCSCTIFVHKVPRLGPPEKNTDFVFRRSLVPSGGRAD